MEVLIGDRVRWESPDGTQRGEVVAIFNALDDAGDTVDFYHIAINDGFGGFSYAMISETAVYDIEFKVIFRDVAIQIARGEKVVA